MQDLNKRNQLYNHYSVPKKIKDWKYALQRAEDVQHPRRYSLHQVYHQIVLDAHITRELNLRYLRVQGHPYAWIDTATNEIDEELTNEFQSPWFDKLLRFAIEKIAFGHSLIQFYMDEDTAKVNDVSLVNRSFVVPEFGLHLENHYDLEGLNYREDAKIYDWLFEIGGDRDLGVLNQCVPHALFKKLAQSLWVDNAELFTSPLRVGRTNVKKTAAVTRMEKALKDMSSSYYMILDDKEQVEFVEQKSTNVHMTYEALINRCNAEMSKAINGAVIGDKEEGGSRAKEEVGERITEMIMQADIRQISNFINHEVKDKLMKRGYSLDGKTFKFQKTKDIDKLWEVTKGLLDYKEIPNEFITETFGIPVEDNPEPQAPTPEEIAQREKEQEVKLSALLDERLKKALADNPFFG